MLDLHPQMNEPAERVVVDSVQVRAIGQPLRERFGGHVERLPTVIDQLVRR